MKLSVIIPVYKTEKYLAQCLDSVLMQICTEYEIICVNDGSPDTCADILQIYQQRDPRIRVIEQVNKGLAISRNVGMEHARGEYIFFLDSDDILDNPSVLQNLMTQAEKYCADVCLGQNTAFPDDAEDQDLVAFSKNICGYLSPVPGFIAVTDEGMEAALRAITSTAWGKLYKKDFLQKQQITFIEQNIIHEDENFHLKVLAACPRIAVLEDTIIRYRIRRDSIMGQNRIKHQMPRAQDRQIRTTLMADALAQIVGNSGSKIVIKTAKAYAQSFSGKKPFFSLIWKDDLQQLKILGKNFLLLQNLGTRRELKFLKWKIQFKGLSLRKYLQKISDIQKRHAKEAVIEFYPRHLLDTLRRLEPFYFLPNKGNFGDVVIASAEMHLFDKIGIRYATLDMDDLSDIKSSFTLVCGGGHMARPVFE